MPDPAPTTPDAFIAHWQKAEANERANSQSFLIGLTQMSSLPTLHSHLVSTVFQFRYIN